MTRRFGMGALLGASALVLTGVAAMAQNSASPSGSPSASGAPSGGSSGSSFQGSGGGGSSTAGSLDTSVTTTTTVASADDGLGTESVADDSTTLANTGGSPLIVSMLGTLLASGGLLLRRKFN